MNRCSHYIQVLNLKKKCIFPFRKLNEYFNNTFWKKKNVKYVYQAKIKVLKDTLNIPPPHVLPILGEDFFFSSDSFTRILISFSLIIMFWFFLLSFYWKKIKSRVKNTKIIIIIAICLTKSNMLTENKKIK